MDATIEMLIIMCLYILLCNTFKVFSGSSMKMGFFVLFRFCEDESLMSDEAEMLDL